MQYFDKTFLWRIGNHIGKTLKVDSNHIRALQEEIEDDEIKHGRFARICIEVDLRKKLQPKVQVWDRTFGVEYEGLHLICFECGKFGHRKDSCPTLKKALPGEGGDVNVDPSQKIPTNFMSSGGSDNQQVEKDSTFGPWMIAKRNNRRPETPLAVEGNGTKGRSTRGNPRKEGPKFMTTGSRFAVMNEDFMEDSIDMHEAMIGNDFAINSDTNHQVANSSRSLDKGKGPMISGTPSQIARVNNKGVYLNKSPRALSIGGNKGIQKKEKKSIGNIMKVVGPPLNQNHASPSMTRKFVGSLNG